VVWPVLRQEGFAAFDTRTAWRHTSDRIDVINFQSFNSYNAEVLGVTPHSFAVNLGCARLEIPFHLEVKTKDGVPFPKEYECDFRARLKRSFFQWRNKHKAIWHIDKEGKSLEKSLADVVSQIKNVALPWFAKLSDKDEVMRILLSEDEKMQELWGFGRNPSPHRSYMTGYLALSLGDVGLGKAKLQEAVESGCFSAVIPDLDTALLRSNPSLTRDAPTSGVPVS
jgi:hypothetical protein